MKPKGILAFVCSLILLLLTGCPEAPMVGGRLTMTFPTGNQDGVGLTLNGDNATNALKLVDSILISNGYERSKGEVFETVYRKSLDGGTWGKLWSSEYVGVNLKGNVLEVYISEGKKPSEEVRISTKKTLALIKDALSSRYGPGGIKVTRTKY